MKPADRVFYHGDDGEWEGVPNRVTFSVLSALALAVILVGVGLWKLLK